jgi:hypothetical protein
MPPQQGIFPRIRTGRRWLNTLWALPIGAATLLCLVALAQSLRELPSVTAFIQSHPGIPQSAPLGAGQGGYNEDHEFYGYRMPI